MGFVNGLHPKRLLEDRKKPGGRAAGLVETGTSRSQAALTAFTASTALSGFQLV
jgi:hypothetical protein